MLSPETVLGDYRLIEQLGEGAAGEVHLATPTCDKPFAAAGRPVALKVYKETILKEKNQLERIQREFTVGSTISHPNLVRIHDFVQPPGQAPFLVMEFIDGVPLPAWLQQFHPIPGALLLAVVEQLVEGLHQLHDRGIIHRDIKPANIMMSSAFEMKLMDLGVVHITTSTPITDENKFLGSIRNSSPEYLRGRAYDHRTDLYSFGTVLYSLLFGEELFSEEQHFARLADLVEKREPHYDVAAASHDHISDGLLSLTRRLLSKDPGQRPQDLTHVSEALAPLRSIMATAPASEPLHGYVATALTNLDRDGRGYITFASSMIAEVAKAYGFYVYQPRRSTDPVLHRGFDAETVYNLDRKKVVNADLLIVLLNKPSFGVGQELEIAASYGKPTLLIREDGIDVSRMVLGAPTHIVGDITYTTPEDLQRKLAHMMPSVREQVSAWRAGVGRHKARILLGPRLKERRLAAGYSTVDSLASALGIAPRLLRSIEMGHNENVGIHVLESLCAALQCQLSDLTSSPALPADPDSVDLSIRRLERLAKKAGWSAADLIELREDYVHETAARGSHEVLADAEWIARRAALEKRRIGAEPSLFEGHNA
jgi:serine/threonine protein kinase/transcriptional regulator with XRE-family HTH domain